MKQKDQILQSKASSIVFSKEAFGPVEHASTSFG